MTCGHANLIRNGELMTGNHAVTAPAVALLGAGSMSATVGVVLKKLAPALNIEM
jgi:hypothetical protein